MRIDPEDILQLREGMHEIAKSLLARNDILRAAEIVAAPLSSIATGDVPNVEKAAETVAEAITEAGAAIAVGLGKVADAIDRR